MPHIYQHYLLLGLEGHAPGMLQLQIATARPHSRLPLAPGWLLLRRQRGVHPMRASGEARKEGSGQGRADAGAFSASEASSGGRRAHTRARSDFLAQLAGAAGVGAAGKSCARSSFLFTLPIALRGMAGSTTSSEGSW